VTVRQGLGKSGVTVRQGLGKSGVWKGMKLKGNSILEEEEVYVKWR